MTSRLGHLFLLFSLVLAGCPDDEGPSDGGTSDGGSDAGGGYAEAPRIDWLAEGIPPVTSVNIEGCPEGWREVDVDGHIECDPYPEAGAGACAVGEAHFPGEPGCRPIGEACPAGEFATSLPATDVIYVSPTSTAGGDGTLARPFRALDEVVWSTLPAGTTVALGKGTFVGGLPLRSGVTVVGACVAETLLRGEATLVPSVITVTQSGDPATVRNLSVVDAPKPGAEVQMGRSLILEGVRFDRMEEIAVIAFGRDASVTLTDVVLSRTQPLSVDGTSGRGLVVESGASLEATRVIVTESRDVGVLVAADADVTLNDSVVQGTMTPPGSPDGRGVNVQEAARFTARRTLVEGNEGAGVYVSDAGSEVTLEDVVIRDSIASSLGTALGLEVRRGARATVDGLTILRTHAIGIFTKEPGSTIDARDVVLRETQPDARTGGFGRGLAVEEGATISVERFVVADNHEVGVVATDPGSSITLVDAVIRETRSQVRDTVLGRGLQVQANARVEVTRAIIRGNHTTGAFISFAGELSLSDVLIRDTVPEEVSGMFGRGLTVQSGGQLALTRVVVEEAHDTGIFVAEAGSAVTLADVVVREIAPNQALGFFGRGVQVQFGASVIGDRVQVADVYEAGVTVLGSASAELRDLDVARVSRAACADSDCMTTPFGYGVAAEEGALRIDGFQITDAEICGAFLSTSADTGVAASVDLENGLVTRATIGACVQVGGYDLSRLSGNVEYRDNGTNLDATSLPVPGAAELEELGLE